MRSRLLSASVCKSKKLDYDEYIGKLKKNGQWHVEVGTFYFDVDTSRIGIVWVQSLTLAPSLPYT